MPQEQISERTLKNSGYWIGDETVKVVYIILLERVQCIGESPPSEGHMSFSTKSRSCAWITCAGQKVATTYMRIEPMVVEHQCHIREGSESSCIFLACSSYLRVFFGFFVSVTTKITVQRSECGLHSMRMKKIVGFRSAQNRFYQLFGAILATSDMLQRDDVVHCFCPRSRGCFLSKQR